MNAKKNLQSPILISFFIGVILLFLKFFAWWITNSAAIFSDLAESIIHVFAVGFAAYSMHISLKPADKNHLYGHDRVTFFSAGFEGAMIVVAAISILYTSIDKLIFGFTIEHIDAGILVSAITVVVNGTLSWWLLNRTEPSLILQANGYHILTDCITSCGVIIALVLVHFTGHVWFDPFVACLTALNIMKTGLQLVNQSIHGLMDHVDLKFDQELRRALSQITQKNHLQYHRLKHRNTGAKTIVEYHLLFPDSPSLKKAHEEATKVEEQLVKQFGPNIAITSHLEPLEGHNITHAQHGLAE